MSQLITRVTRGRITTGTSKKVLVLAMAGIMYFATVAPDLGGGGAGRRTAHGDGFNIEKVESINEFNQIILVEDSEIVELVKAALKITFI